MLAWLFVGHMTGDFLLQTRWMADEKNTSWIALIVHSITYTLSVYIFSIAAGGLSSLGLVLIFIGHLVLDKRSLVAWWTSNINGSPDLPWMKMLVDQSWHVLLLALAAFI